MPHRNSRGWHGTKTEDANGTELVQVKNMKRKKTQTGDVVQSIYSFSGPKLELNPTQNARNEKYKNERMQSLKKCSTNGP